MPQCCFQQGKFRCPGESAPVCASWGVGDGFCDQHIWHVRARLNNKSAALGGEPGQFVRNIIALHKEPAGDQKGLLIEDYIKIFALMLDRKFCKQQLARLNGEILSVAGAAVRIEDSPQDERFNEAKREKDQQYVRMSRVLEYYEGLCWFPTTHRLYTGSLSSDNYQSSIALGYMPKDAGAGADHGEYSHRLQWHIIMRIVTSNFTDAYNKVAWHHSPLKLFCYLGSQEAMQLNYWGFMLDAGSGVCYDNPAVLNNDVSGSFESAVELDNWRNANQLLARNVQRRTDKRRRILKRAAEIYRALPERQKSETFTPSGLDFESNVIGLLEKWKKLGKPLLVNTKQWYDRGHFHEGHNDILNKIVRTLWKELHLKNVSDKHKAYQQDPSEPHAALLKGDSLMTKELIASRVEASMARLNTAAFGYTNQVGAYRKMDARRDAAQLDD
jgi:hypothetical protein